MNITKTAIFNIFMIGVTCGLLLGTLVSGCNFKKQAISRGFAEYNQTNGNWQWKDIRIKQLEDKTK